MDTHVELRYDGFNSVQQIGYTSVQAVLGPNFWVRFISDRQRPIRLLARALCGLWFVNLRWQRANVTLSDLRLRLLRKRRTEADRYIF